MPESVYKKVIVKFDKLSSALGIPLKELLSLLFEALDEAIGGGIDKH